MTNLAHTLAMQSPDNSLRDIRKRRGLSLDQLAEMVGTTAVQLGRLEKGERRFTFDWARRIAEALDIDPADLLPDRAGSVGVAFPLAFGATTAIADPEVLRHRVLLPALVSDPERCFAAYLADDHADRLYPPRSLLVARRIETLPARLVLGTKVIAEARLPSGTAHLVGLVDLGPFGDLVLSLRSNNRQVPPSVLVQRPEPTPDNERLAAFAPPPLKAVDYQPLGNDPARIIGRVILAITPEAAVPDAA